MFLPLLFQRPQHGSPWLVYHVIAQGFLQPQSKNMVLLKSNGVLLLYTFRFEAVIFSILSPSV